MGQNYKLSSQMSVTSHVIAPYLSAYQKAESARTVKWTNKQLRRVAATLKRNCKFDSAGVIKKCGAVSG